MLETRQIGILSGIGAAFWLVDVAWIRWLPLLVADPLWGNVGFLLSIPVAWICVRLVRRLAALDVARLVPGITLMVAVAALIHALALRWRPGVYGDDHVGRLGGAWLLWIYGLVLGLALLMAHAPRRVGSAATRS